MHQRFLFCMRRLDRDIFPSRSLQCLSFSRPVSLFLFHLCWEFSLSFVFFFQLFFLAWFTSLFYLFLNLILRFHILLSLSLCFHKTTFPYISLLPLTILLALLLNATLASIKCIFSLRKCRV